MQKKRLQKKTTRTRADAARLMFRVGNADLFEVWKNAAQGWREVADSTVKTLDFDAPCG
jgi:hypothetical protein